MQQTCSKGLFSANYCIKNQTCYTKQTTGKTFSNHATIGAIGTSLSATNSPRLMTSSHLGSICSSPRYGEQSAFAVLFSIVKPSPRNAHLRASACLLSSGQNENLRVVSILICDVVVFVSWLFDDLHVMKGAAGEHGIHPAGLVV